MPVALMDSCDITPTLVPLSNPNHEGEGEREGEEEYYLVKEEEEKELKVIEWEEYEKELVRMWSLSSSVNKAKAKRDALLHKLNPILQVRKQSLSRENELEAMLRRFDSQKRKMGSALLSLSEMSKEVQAREEKLKPSIQSLLGAAKTLSAARGRLQEANRLLAGEGGHGPLRHLQKMLSTRQQLMVTQVASLYPLGHCPSQSVPAEESKSGSQQTISGEFAGSSSVSTSSDLPVESLTISGLQLFAPPVKKLGFFSDKQAFQSSAAAIGYVAHIVKLVASYLDIPLRYPIRLGGSRSYVQDYAPSVEPSIIESGAFGVGGLQKPVVEFPLFLEGQDPTRSAYAVFLLNKDMDQMLSYIGVPSFGPRHTLPNLKWLIRSIQSDGFLCPKTPSFESTGNLERR